MSYTFGGATGDDINGVTNNMGATNTASIVAGWWYPTTLTAGRGYWSAGSVFGAEVGTTTSEIRLRTDNVTDGAWDTSGAGIATNKWWFLAFANSCLNAGPATAWRVWVGDLDTRPTEVTVSVNTANSGNFSGATGMVQGNKGATGTVSFQGEGGSMTWIRTLSPNVNGLVPVATSGTITNAEAQYMLERIVLPLWAGEVPPWFRTRVQTGNVANAMHYPDCASHREFTIGDGQGTGGDALNRNGVTFSGMRTPRAFFHPLPNAVNPALVASRGRM